MALVGTARVSACGNWIFSAPFALPEGEVSMAGIQSSPDPNSGVIGQESEGATIIGMVAADN
jgi:hypothetical protein